MMQYGMTATIIGDNGKVRSGFSYEVVGKD